MNDMKTGWVLASIFAVLLVLSGCEWRGEESLKVTAVDEATGQPVRDVWVSFAVQTEGPLQFGSSTGCDNIAAAQTAADGSVALTLPPMLTFGATSWWWEAYKEGYEVKHFEPEKQLLMVRSTESPEARVETLLRIQHRIICYYGDGKAALPMHQAIVGEVYRLREQSAESAATWKGLLVPVCRNWARAALPRPSRGQATSESDREEEEWLAANSPTCYATIKTPVQWQKRACKRTSDGKTSCND